MSLDPMDLEKTLARDFGGRDLLSEKRWLHLLREKVRRQNHERGSERIGARAIIEPSCLAFGSLETRSNSFIKLNELSPNIILRLVS